MTTNTNVDADNLVATNSNDAKDRSGYDLYDKYGYDNEGFDYYGHDSNGYTRQDLIRLLKEGIISSI